jgi:hypothetical protein
MSLLCFPLTQQTSPKFDVQHPEVSFGLCIPQIHHVHEVLWLCNLLEVDFSEVSEVHPTEVH